MPPHYLTDFLHSFGLGLPEMYTSIVQEKHKCIFIVLLYSINQELETLETVQVKGEKLCTEQETQKRFVFKEGKLFFLQPPIAIFRFDVLSAICTKAL